MDIGLIALDMDGTVIGANDAVTPANAEAIRAAVQAGIHVLICSGRIIPDIQLYMKNAGLFQYWLAGYNGALVMDGPGGNITSKRTFPVELGRRVQDVALQYPTLLTAFLEHEILYVTPEDGLPLADDFVLVRQYPIALDVERMRHASEEGVLKYVLFDDPNRPRIADVKEHIKRELPELSPASSWTGNIELNAPGVNKGEAVRLVAEKLGIPRENVMAVGDQVNDLPMLEWAGVGVAMGNATEKVRKRCRHHTDVCGRDGVAKAIQRYAFGGLA